MTDWYSRALDRARGVVTPTQRAAPPQYAPQYPPQYSQPNPPTQWHDHSGFMRAPTQPQALNTQQKVQQATLSDLFAVQEQGRGQPGPGAQSNPDPCPGCGGALFIENLPGGKKRRGPPPAPHCFTCGWNGLFDQGLESTWAS